MRRVRAWVVCITVRSSTNAEEMLEEDIRRVWVGRGYEGHAGMRVRSSGNIEGSGDCIWENFVYPREILLSECKEI
jgi:hypothetical protein